MNNFNSVSAITSNSSDSKQQLERCQQWLAGISSKEARFMPGWQEYQEFMRAFKVLEQAHRRNQDNEVARQSLLHHDDHILLRVLDFLDSQSLVRVTACCSRLRVLARRSAQQRTLYFARTRQLTHELQLLRAIEQMEGYNAPDLAVRVVRTPILLLERRVVVTECGDAEFNGIYYCTGCDANGFVFTKPRAFKQRTEGVDEQIKDNFSMSRPAPLLQCIISKSFSEETILWYLSKESIAATDPNHEVQHGSKKQLYYFWSKLTTADLATPEICCYPSQSSMLSEEGEAWQTLETTGEFTPPTLELMD